MSDEPAYSHVIIQGVGLIGGSVAAAVRQRWPACHVSGLGRSKDRLQAAEQAGLLDDWALSIHDLKVESGAIVVICLPVDSIAAAVMDAAQATPTDVLITDAGSVKQSIQLTIAGDATAEAQFVGAHPIAGSEKSGFENADARLFENRPCIVTKSAAGRAFEERCCDFWRGIGATISVLTPEEHDRILALTSHLPHILAAVGAGCLTTDELPFAGTGFRDTTRVAAGDASLWQQILCSNSSQILMAIRQAESAMSELADAIERSDNVTVQEILEQAAAIRQAAGD